MTRLNANPANFFPAPGKTPRLLCALAAGLLLSAAAAHAQGPARSTTCVVCHLSAAAAPGWQHVAAWQASRHAAADIGCHACHGGDPAAKVRAVAHVGVLMPPHPNSPVRRAGLPATCGRCHDGQRAEFRMTSHFQLLQKLDRAEARTQRAPTCSTCHGNVGVRPSATAVEGQCRICHGAGGQRPRFERIGQVAGVVEQARRLRVQLAAAERLIEAVDDPGRRRALQVSAVEARGSLATALESLHRFVFERTGQSLDAASQRTRMLYDQLLAP